MNKIKCTVDMVYGLLI